MTESFNEKFKQAKIRAKLGYYAQNTPVKPLDGKWDEVVELIILKPTMDLSFEVVADEGVLALYSIHNIEQAKLLLKEPHAYQVSLFNKDKAVGNIKYQIDWIQP